MSALRRAGIDVVAEHLDPCRAQAFNDRETDQTDADNADRMGGCVHSAFVHGRGVCDEHVAQQM